jgi:hypothetical protein
VRFLDRLGPAKTPVTGPVPSAWEATHISICPGEPVFRNGTPGILVGTFQDGTLPISGPNGLERVNGKELVIHHPVENDVHDYQVTSEFAQALK